MRWHRLVVVLFVFAVGVFLAAGNLWHALARSTIPLSLASRVERKELRHEKHPGRDDVCLLHLESGATLHVDPAVFEAVAEGERIRKEAWSAELLLDSKPLALSASRDVWGMLIVMPLALFIFAVAGAMKLRQN